MADFIRWTSQLSVGIEEFDQQHRVLIDLLNRMHHAVRLGEDELVLRGLLSRFVDATRIHFAAEESLMRVMHYPRYESHKLQHENLLQTLVEMQHGLLERRRAFDDRTLQFLKLWLTQHILDTDQQYTDFLVEGGVKPVLAKKSWKDRIWDYLYQPQ